MKIAIGDEFYHPWKWTVVQTILFMFPGYVIRIPWLMLAGLIPIARYIYRYLMDASEPRQMRQAYKLYLKRDWEKARMLIDELIQINPDYMPARFFLFELKMRLGDFDGAEAFLTETHNELDTENLQSAQDAMVIRRRIAERKKELFPVPLLRLTGTTKQQPPIH